LEDVIARIQKPHPELSSTVLMLSWRCGLNIKHFQTLEYSQEMTLMTEKKSQEEDHEVQCHL